MLATTQEYILSRPSQGGNFNFFCLQTGVVKCKKIKHTESDPSAIHKGAEMELGKCRLDELRQGKVPRKRPNP